jgi:hypothetical protein
MYFKTCFNVVLAQCQLVLEGSNGKYWNNVAALLHMTALADDIVSDMTNFTEIVYSDKQTNSKTSEFSSV